MAKRLTYFPLFMKGHVGGIARSIGINALTWRRVSVTSFVFSVSNPTYGITVSTSNSAVISVTPIVTGKWTIAAVSVGSCTLTIDEMVGGAHYTQNIDVNVI